MEMNTAADDDVERLFGQLVAVISRDSPDRLRSPIEVAEIYQRILPYRRYRSQLRFDTNEDYEMALLRLLAGEGGFVSLDPPEVQDALATEAEAVNPQPGTFREYAAAKVFLNSQAVAALNGTRDAYAPPDPEPVTASTEPATSEPVAHESPSLKELDNESLDMDRRPVTLPFLPDDRVTVPPPAGLELSPTFLRETGRTRSCTSCTKPLPRGRAVIFCPFCGASQRSRPCPHCQTNLDADWRFCISCGRDVTPTHD